MGCLDIDAPIFDLRRQFMIKRAYHAEGFDFIVKVSTIITARAFVRLAVKAIALIIRTDSRRSAQRPEGPLSIRQYLMLRRKPENRARVKVMQIAEGCTAAAIGSRQGRAVGADHNSIIRSRGLRRRGW